MKWGLENKVLEVIYKSLRGFEGVNEVQIFGSRARNDFKKTSDIDLVLTKHSLDFQTFLKLKAQLQDLPILYRVDVLDFDSIDNLALKEQIETQGEVFYTKSES